MATKSGIKPGGIKNYSNFTDHFKNKLNKSILCGKVQRIIHDKTAVVIIARQVRFKNANFYKDREIKFKKYMVHDEKNQMDFGDEVLIKKSRPHSKMKHWEFHKFVKKDPGASWARRFPEVTATKEELRKREKDDRLREELLVQERGKRKALIPSFEELLNS